MRSRSSSARLGAAVVVGGRRPEPLEETIAQIEDWGGRGHWKPTDVRDPEQVDALVADAVKRFDRVDVLVNNAAGNFVVRAQDLSPNGWRAVVGDRPGRRLPLLARRGAADDRAGRRRRDPERARELCVDGRAGNGPLGRGQGRPPRDDPHARGRVGRRTDPRELHLSRPDRHRGRGRRRSGRREEDRARVAAAVSHWGASRRRRRSPGGRPRSARLTPTTSRGRR